MSRVLVAWVGATDLKAAKGDGDGGIGPIAQAVVARTFDQVVLISDYDKSIVAAFESWLKTKTAAEITIRHEKLPSPTDYAAIYRAVSKNLDALRAKLGPKGKLTFHLSPGTSAMATVWILVAPKYKAELLQSSKERGVETANIPFEIASEFVPALVRQADAEIARLGEGERPKNPGFSDILHRSEAVSAVLERAQAAAVYSESLLIEGESGTGKELLARAVHKASGRKADVFIAVNCGAIPRDLVESTFFGHTRGSFTGATSDHEGAILAADGGTLFLDEVGELPLEAQVKLLRALQEKKVQRIGGKAEKAVDVRVIAATNRDLLAEVGAGRFREDLYFRLAVFVLRNPPLREREGDVLLLVDDWLARRNAERSGRDQKKLSPAAKNLLLRHPWPGNVRELQATLLRAFVWSKGTTIDETAVREALMVRPQKSGDVLHRPLGSGFNLEDCQAEVARHYLSRAIEEAHGNKTKAAELVGAASYQTLKNWAKKYGVEV